VAVAKELVLVVADVFPTLHGKRNYSYVAKWALFN